MYYSQNIIIKNGKEALLRNGVASDAKELLANIIETHLETDYLLSYPDENTLTAEKEARYLEEKATSTDSVEIVAIVDGQIVGSAGINPIGDKYKVKHRADFGISLIKDYWGLGIGSALMDACIECARKAGFIQLELVAVAENDRALNLYKKIGFVEYGRNPKGFNSINTVCYLYIGYFTYQSIIVYFYIPSNSEITSHIV